MDSSKLDNNSDQLIENMVGEFRPRPWWKRPNVFSKIWLGINLLSIFGFINGSNFNGTFNQWFFSILILLFFGINWWFFYRHLNPILDDKERLLATSPKVLFSILGISLFMGLIIHHFILGDLIFIRNWFPRMEDMDCFSHTLRVISIPILFFPFFFQKYFVIKKMSAVLQYCLSIFLLGLMAMNINCQNLDLSHLIWGHYSTILGVGFIVFAWLVIFKKMIFLKI